MTTHGIGQRLRDFADLYWVLVTTAGLVVVGFVGMLLFARSAAEKAASPVAAAALMIGLAFLTLGVLVGLLFGIPRSPQSPNSDSPSNADDSRSRRFNPNTNLEQVSDWLTKILVGVGLTQLTVAPENALKAAKFLSASLGGSPAGVVVAFVAMVHFSVCGFLFGYLVARLYLPGAFRRADLEEIRSAASNATAAIEGSVLSLLYQPPPYGFTKAIELTERVAPESRSGALWSYLAAARAQEFRKLAEEGATQDDLARVRKQALEASRKAIEVDPSEKGRLHLLWDPPSGSDDDDLRVFLEDPEFRKLLG